MRWHRLPNPRRDGGFTMVEVVVAALILGLIAVTMGQMFTVGLFTAGQAGSETRALNLAQGKIEELRQEATLDLGQTNGDFTGDDAGYRWVATVGPPGDYGVKEVTVEVFYQWRGEEKSVLLTTLLSGH